MSKYCTNTDVSNIITDERAIKAVVGYESRLLWGRKVCADCHGVVLETEKGNLRKHVRGSNLTPGYRRLAEQYFTIKREQQQ